MRCLVSAEQVEDSGENGHAGFVKMRLESIRLNVLDVVNGSIINVWSCRQIAGCI
jgi:hypothetical protein